VILNFFLVTLKCGAETLRRLRRICEELNESRVCLGPKFNCFVLGKHTASAFLGAPNKKFAKSLSLKSCCLLKQGLLGRFRAKVDTSVRLPTGSRRGLVLVSPQGQGHTLVLLCVGFVVLFAFILLLRVSIYRCFFVLLFRI
jgi:hypothetical protein